MNEDLKKYNMEQINNKKLLREKYKEIEKANYEIAQQKKQKRLSERESDKKAMNEYMDYFLPKNKGKENQMKIMQQKNEKEISGINQFTKHQNAINNYEEQKYKREMEEEKKKLIDEEKIQKDEKKENEENEEKKENDENEEKKESDEKNENNDTKNQKKPVKKSNF